MEENNTQQILPVDLLKEYINTFYGYGKWSNSDFWFIGIEEGGGDFAGVEKRLFGWDKLGKEELVDKDLLHEFFSVNYNRYTHKSLTWKGLILAKLSFENKETEEADINSMKGTDWGQSTSKNLLIELFPLPSPIMNKWAYPCWIDTKTELKYLVNRKSYRAELALKRIETIKRKIKLHKPRVVLFYGSSMAAYWDQIIGQFSLDVIEVCNQKVRYIKIDETCYFQCPHPASRALNSIMNEFWIKVGEVIREHSKK